MTFRPTDIQTIDMQRATRLLLAWTTEDLLALNAVLEDVERDDDAGRASHSLLAAVAHTACLWGEAVAAANETRLAEVLRALLIEFATEEARGDSSL